MTSLPFRRFLAVAMMAVVTACAQPPVPTDTFYRLDVADPERAPGPAVGGVVEVRSLDADGLMAERAIVYSDAGSPSLRQYNYHFWVEAPTAAVQRELTDHLRATGLFEQVVTPRFRVRPDVEVQGRIARMEQILDGNGGARVVVELELGAQQTGRGMGLLLLDTYRVEAPAVDASPGAAAEAMRAALQDIFVRFTADLAAAMRAAG